MNYMKGGEEQQVHLVKYDRLDCMTECRMYQVERDGLVEVGDSHATCGPCNATIPTVDGKPISANMRVYNYYDCKWGIVTPGQFTRGGLTGVGGTWFSGWYDVKHDDGTSALLDGSRMCTYER